MGVEGLRRPPGASLWTSRPVPAWRGGERRRWLAVVAARPLCHGLYGRREREMGGLGSCGRPTATRAP